MAEVLIIDDDQMFCDLLARKMRKMNHHVIIEHSVTGGLTRAQSGHFDAVLLDVRLPDGSGLDILPELRKVNSVPEIIIVTGDGDPDGAELAIASGAWDYIEKGASLDAMIFPLTRALQYRKERTEHAVPTALHCLEIAGNGTRISQAIDEVAKASSTDVNVLITGETGTGKELFARAIHDNSDRRAGNFVVVDCAALPDTLVESLLFGYKKGAFTGADADRQGLIKQADNGTLFLDEVAEMPLSLQKAFLRVLQEFRFRPLGSQTEVHSRFRIIAATHQNLDEMVKNNTFRKDLLYRLRSFSLELPPLRQRTEDIASICMLHMPRICERYNFDLKGLSPAFMEALITHHWPGNVRELIHVLERAITAARFDPVLYPFHLPTELRIRIARQMVGQNKTDIEEDLWKSDDAGTFPTYKQFRKNVLERFERKYFSDLQDISQGDIAVACSLSGLSRSRLYDLLNKQGLTGQSGPANPKKSDESPIFSDKTSKFS